MPIANYKLSVAVNEPRLNVLMPAERGSFHLRNNLSAP
jgi:hypothetical protein